MTDERDPINAGKDPAEKTEMLVNEYGETRDAAVVIDEPGRTVMLTEDETVVVDKGVDLPFPPKDRPRKVYDGMWGQMEIAVFGVSLLTVLAALLFYLFIVVPSSRQLEVNRATRDRLESELQLAQSKYGDITSTESHVAKLAASVDDFESGFLPTASTGQASLYQKLNGLIAAYGLVNTNGPTYAPLELADVTGTNESDEQRGRARYRSLFPGVYVTTTVDGPYSNIRRFIREIETGSEFIVITAVELAQSESTGDSDPGQSAGPTVRFNEVTGQPEQVIPQSTPQRGRTHGERVSLRLEMAAYFQRPDRPAIFEQ